MKHKERREIRGMSAFAWKCSCDADLSRLDEKVTNAAEEMGRRGEHRPTSGTTRNRFGRLLERQSIS
jgi:hypothetical protein